MGDKLRDFRLNENPTSTSFTKNLNQIVAQVKKANNIKLKVKGGTGGKRHSRKGDTLQVNIPKTKNVGDTTQWAIVITPPEYDNPVRNNWVVQKASVNTSDEWEGDGDDITIERVLGYEGFDSNAEDVRNWTNWPLTDGICKIVNRFDEAEGDNIWYMDMPMMYTGPPDEASLRFSQKDGYTQAVWI